MTKKRYFNRKTILLSLIVLVLLASAGAFAYVKTRTDDEPNDEQTQQEGNEINYGPPTEEEQQAGDDQKQQIVEDQAESNTPPSTASVVIADARQYGSTIEVRAFVSNIIKAGTCTFTFTKGGANIQKQTQAFEDASTTQCTALAVPRSEFPSAGKWTVTVKYQSSQATGETKQEIEVQ